MKKIGIINFSSNCYLNVIIQLFLSCKNTYDIIFHYLEYDNKRCVFNPKGLMNKLCSVKINVNIQNDAHEKIKYKYTCKNCNKKRIIEDIFSTFYVYGNSLEESIKRTINTETFMLKCENCVKNTVTDKIGQIENLGKVLIFYNIVKNDIKITENITFGNVVYNLTGLIKHYGNQQSGHYIFIDYKNKLMIDDTNIIKCENISFDNIYMIIYTV